MRRDCILDRPKASSLSLGSSAEDNEAGEKQPDPHLDSMGPCFSRGLIFFGHTGSAVVSMTLVSPLL